MSGIKIITAKIRNWTPKDRATVHDLWVFLTFPDNTRSSNMLTSWQLPLRVCRLRIRIERATLDYRDTCSKERQLVQQFQNLSTFPPQRPQPSQKQKREEPLHPSRTAPAQSET